MITRGQLYDAIWSKPLFHVAADLGVSDSFLRTVCVHEDMPTPSRGHWAQSLGKSPPQPRRLPGERNAQIITRRRDAVQLVFKSQVALDETSRRSAVPPDRVGSRASAGMLVQAPVSIESRDDDLNRASGSLERPDEQSAAIPPRGATATDLRLVEAASRLWASQRQILDFLFQLETVTALLPHTRATRAREVIRHARLDLQARDAIRTFLEHLGGPP